MNANGNGTSFQARRKRVMDAIAPGATAILPSAPIAIRSGDVEFIYRQDNDFYYLTGFAEPESVAHLLIRRRCGGRLSRFARSRQAAHQSCLPPQRR